MAIFKDRRKVPVLLLFINDLNSTEGEVVRDLELTIKPMLPSAVISNFVEEIPDSNYEIYLRELVNSSAYFLDKGKSIYSGSPSEEVG